MLLSELHDVLQAVTGADAERHAFSLPDVRRRSRSRDSVVQDMDERSTRLVDVAGVGTRLHYECVGEACWRYRLDVETVRPVEPDIGYPVCLAGRSPCPGAPADFDLGGVNQRLASLQRAPAAGRGGRERAQAHRVLGAMLKRGRVTAEEVGSRIAGLAPHAVRSELVALIDKAESFAARMLVVDAFIEVGLGDCVRRLQGIAADTTRSISTRGLAFEILSLLEPTATASILAVMTPPQRELLLEEQFGNLLVTTQVDPGAAVLVAQTLADQVSLGDDAFLSFLESCRALVGVPAAVVYAEALVSPALTPIRSRLLEILVADGGSQVAALLERVRDETTEPVWRSRLQRALVLVLTDAVRLGPRRPAVAGQAWATRDDSLGCHVVFAHVEAPRASALASVVACRDGGFHDGEVVPLVSREDAERRLAAFVRETGDRLVAVPLAEVAARVAVVARRTRERGLDTPRRTAAAVELIESARDGSTSRARVRRRR